MSRCNLGPTPKIEFNDLPLEIFYETSKTTRNLVIVQTGLITA